MLDFPCTPTTGQHFDGWTFDGSRWVRDVVKGVSVEVGNTPPADPQSGDLWWDTTSSTLFVWTGSAWVVTVPSAPPMMTLLSTVTAANNAYVDFVLDDAFATYAFMILRGIAADQYSGLCARLSIDGGVNFIATNYASQAATFSASPPPQYPTSSTQYIFSDPANTAGQAAGGEGNSGLMYLYNARNAGWSAAYVFTGNAFSAPSVSRPVLAAGTTLSPNVGKFNKIRFFSNTGNIYSGIFKMYGIT